jgi:hypothetical protein
MNIISDKELIEKFLRSELLEEEQLLFNTRKKDEDFLTLLEESILTYQGRLTLKDTFKGIGDELKTENKKSYKKPLVWLSGIAASILLFLAFQFFSTNTLSSTELFDTYFDAYPNAHAIKGNTDGNSIVKKAFQFYDNAQYEEATKAFKQLAATKTLNSSEHFYFGISLLITNKIEASKLQLSKINKEYPLYSEAQWYTCLALIKQDSLDKVKSILKSKKLSFSTYRNDKVKKLLNQMK